MEPSICHNPPSHPPCLVCDGRGTGIHYGINTCEACKGFFARCLRRPPLSCKRKSSCIVDHTHRHCAACRLQRCVTLGMSKNACRVGRITSAQKASVIHEVKRLELQAKMKHDGTHVTLHEHQRNMEDIVKLLTDTKLQIKPNTAAMFEDAMDKEQEYLAQKLMKDSLFGSRGMIPRKEYQEIYCQTGMDVDGRREMMKQVLPMVDKGVDDFQTFAKLIPGFINVPEKDQKKLLKASLMEFNLFKFAHTFNTEQWICLHPFDSNIVLGFEEMYAWSDDSLELSQRLARKTRHIQQQDLTDEEVSLIGAMCIMNADAEVCSDTRRILSQSTEYILEMLQYELNKNHDPEDRTLPKIVMIICDQRRFKNMFEKYFANVLNDCNDLGLSDATKDILSDDKTDCQNVCHDDLTHKDKDI